MHDFIVSYMGKLFVIFWDKLYAFNEVEFAKPRSPILTIN